MEKVFMIFAQAAKLLSYGHKYAMPAADKVAEFVRPAAENAGVWADYLKQLHGG